MIIHRKDFDVNIMKIRNISYRLTVNNNRKAQKSKGKLILLATHVQEDVEQLCDEVYEMRAGELKRTEILKY